jgi:hypothetical protein
VLLTLHDVTELAKDPGAARYGLPGALRARILADIWNSIIQPHHPEWGETEMRPATPQEIRDWRVEWPFREAFDLIGNDMLLTSPSLAEGIGQMFAAMGAHLKPALENTGRVHGALMWHWIRSGRQRSNLPRPVAPDLNVIIDAYPRRTLEIEYGDLGTGR